jgi:hypothetical protein
MEGAMAIRKKFATNGITMNTGKVIKEKHCHVSY